ncbi:hypothetical protein ACF09C_01235 [Streptomyces sp. NPDC014870]|uniref:hypothetical protein n=1 Tax=Streptomyces sp. NPDC014870 TaxID=3364925 RepID=UPI0036F75EAE
MTELEALVRLCPPPTEAPPAVDWASAERALGVTLPHDYKRLVETYGDGIFDETIWLLAPDSAYDDCDLHAQTAERDEILADLWEMGEEKPAALLEPGVRVLPGPSRRAPGRSCTGWCAPGSTPTRGPCSTTRDAAPCGSTTRPGVSPFCGRC